jgi:hypothetical protein
MAFVYRPITIQKVIQILITHQKAELDLANGEREVPSEDTSHRTTLATEGPNLRPENSRSVHQSTQKNTNIMLSNVAFCKLKALLAVQCIVLLHQTCAPDALQNNPSRKSSNN